MTALLKFKMDFIMTSKTTLKFLGRGLKVSFRHFSSSDVEYEVLSN